jgi:hypothetical protein
MEGKDEPQAERSPPSYAEWAELHLRRLAERVKRLEDGQEALAKEQQHAGSLGSWLLKGVAFAAASWTTGFLLNAALELLQENNKRHEPGVWTPPGNGGHGGNTRP